MSFLKQHCFGKSCAYVHMIESYVLIGLCLRIKEMKHRQNKQTKGNRKRKKLKIRYKKISK